MVQSSGDETSHGSKVINYPPKLVSSAGRAIGYLTSWGRLIEPGRSGGSSACQFIFLSIQTEQITDWVKVSNTTPTERCPMD